MVPYLFILTLAWWLSAIAEKKHGLDPHSAQKYKLLLILSLSAFIGFRYYVGTDYGHYIHDYSKFLQKSYIELIFGSDPALKLIAKLGSLIYDSPTTMFISAAFIFVFLYINILAKYSEHFALSTILFILCGTYLDSCNGIRQSIATAIIFTGYSFMRDRKLAKFILIVLLATTFHSSAIVMLPLYFILSCPSKLNTTFWLILITLAITFSYGGLFSIAENITGKPIDPNMSYFNTSVNILRVAVAVAPCALILFLRKSKINELTPYINLVLLNAMIMCITSHSAYLARLGIYSTAFLPLALPPLIYNLQLQKDAIRNLKFIMLILYLIFWLYGIFSSAGLYPYQTIFSAVK